MKYKKTISLILILLSIFLIAAVSAIFIIYKNQKSITQNVIASLNRNFLGQLELKDSHIAPFSNFPYISVDLENLVFYGDKDSKNDTIYFAKDVYVGFRIWDILRGNKIIRAIKVENADLNLVKFSDGNINLLMAKGIEEELEEDEENLALNLTLIIFNVYPHGCT